MSKRLIRLSLIIKSSLVFFLSIPITKMISCYEFDNGSNMFLCKLGQRVEHLFAHVVQKMFSQSYAFFNIHV